ncbi:gas vesicle protein [Streptomyces sp. NPDC049954]|uniref:gas vesicle protein GvpO n=1 Tax=Streptomyces sp. NPDC049954 TaxID=3155779 RepID=UPI00343399DA
MAEHRTRSPGPSSRAAAPTHALKGAEEAAEHACRSLSALISHRAEGVSAVGRAADHEGWRVDVDVLEVPRIPDTTSLLATYAVELDSAGTLLEYHRVRRYRRGAADS